MQPEKEKTKDDSNAEKQVMLILSPMKKKNHISLDELKVMKNSGCTVIVDGEPIKVMVTSAEHEDLDEKNNIDGLNDGEESSELSKSYRQIWPPLQTDKM